MRGPQRRAGRGTRPPLGLGWLPVSRLGTHGPCPLSSGPCVQRSQEARPSSTWSQGSHLALAGQRPKGRSLPAPTTPTPCPFPHAAPSARNASPCPAWHDQRRRRVLSASVPDRPPWAGTSPMTQGSARRRPLTSKPHTKYLGVKSTPAAVCCKILPEKRKYTQPTTDPLAEGSAEAPLCG